MTTNIEGLVYKGFQLGGRLEHTLFFQSQIVKKIDGSSTDDICHSTQSPAVKSESIY